MHCVLHTVATTLMRQLPRAEALLRAQSVGGRLSILRGALAIRNGRLAAMLALREAMGDRNKFDDDDPGAGYPSSTA